jgi:putative heme-binding domain-containing protein
MKMKKMWAAAMVAAGMMAASPAMSQEKLNVFWVKGFYKAEDDALYAAIKKFEAKYKNVKVELSQYPIQDMIPKTVAALDSGTPPDVAYADVYDFQVTASWAYDGKLEDISSVINPIRARFAGNTIETTFLLNNKENKRAYYDKLGGADMLTSSGNDIAAINYPKGPGKQWKLTDAVALLDAPLADRDFQNGKSMFAATTCVRCHAMGSDGGGNVGPDLTNLGTRFSKKDMLESIIDPNKTVSDQYAATQIMLRNGTSVIGRVTNEDKMAYYVSQNPYAPESIEKILKKNVRSVKYSPVSSMLPGLINSLNGEELKDLMAYLMSGGSESNAMFKKK